jgi:hypothetical protein
MLPTRAERAKIGCLKAGLIKITKKRCCFSVPSAYEKTLHLAGSVRSFAFTDLRVTL